MRLLLLPACGEKNGEAYWGSRGWQKGEEVVKRDADVGGGGSYCREEREED